MTRAGVIGGGAWGTALAQVCARAGLATTLWAREADVVASINTSHENTSFLAGVELDPAIRATGDLADLAAADLVLAVAPAQHLRAALGAFAPHAREGLPILLCAKGIEQGSLKLMTQVLEETIPQAAPAVLSGPSFAGEVARGLPTAVTLACADEGCAQELGETIATPTFRPYFATDMIGAEAGGAVKNVLAIACGIVEGKGLGRSAHAALITRGFAEMTRLAVAMGGKPSTLAGLAGLGDLVLTCTGDLSRNRTVGIELARGRRLDEIVGSMRMVAEGVKTTNAAVDLAAQHSVEMPIAAQMYQMLHFGVSPRDAIQALMERSLKGE